MKTTEPSKIFTFVLSFFKNQILIALGIVLLAFNTFDGTIGRFFGDGANLVATSSLQRMELGPTSVNKYKEITDKFKPDEIVKWLETWNENSDKPKNSIPNEESLKSFNRYTDFWLPKEEEIRRYGNSSRYTIVLQNTGNKIAEDIFLISTRTAESAIIERVTNAGIGSPQYETIEHDGKTASLGRLFPNQTTEINIWHEYTIVPSALSITSADGLVDIQQEVTLSSRKEVITILIALGIIILIVNWVFREIVNLLTFVVRKAWKKHNLNNLRRDSDTEPTIEPEES